MQTSFNQNKFDKAKSQVFGLGSTKKKSPKKVAPKPVRKAPPNKDKYHSNLSGGGYMP